MKYLDLIAAILLIVGGLNWGLVGLFGFNVVDFVFSHLPVLARIVYVLVGLSALYEIFKFKGLTCCKK